MRTLPHYSNLLLGRDDARAAVARWLDEGRAVIVTGPGGVGKTRLVAEAVRPRRGVRFCDLTAVRDAQSLFHEVVHTLDGRNDLQQPLHSVVRAARELPGRVLVLDNAEAVADDVGPIVDALHTEAPGLGLVVTSRVTVPAGAAATLELGPLPLEVSRRLFLDRMPPHPVVPVDAVDDRPALDVLCERLEGLPLALELAAARLEVLTLTGLLERLDQSALGTLGDPVGGRSLAAVLDRSLALLDDWHRDALAQLSVFRGSVPLDAAEAVLRPADQRSPLDAVHALVRHRLLVPEPSTSEPRYRLFEVVRERAETLAAPEVRRAAEDRHGDYFAALAEQRLRRPATTDEDHARELADQANMAAVFARAREAPPTSARRAWGAASLAVLPARTLWLPEKRFALTRDALADAPPSVARSMLEQWTATEHRHRFQLDEAIAAARRAVEAAREVGHWAEQLNAMGYLASLEEVDSADHASAEDRFREIAALAEAHDEPTVLSTALAAVANASIRLDFDWDRVLPLYEASLAAAQRTGDRSYVHQGLFHVAQCRMNQGAWAEARELLRPVLEEPVAHASSFERIHRYCLCAKVQLLVGETDDADVTLAMVESVSRRSGFDYSKVRLIRGWIAITQGRLEVAREAIAPVLARPPPTWFEHQKRGLAHLAAAAVAAERGEAAVVDAAIADAELHCAKGRLAPPDAFCAALRAITEGRLDDAREHVRHAGAVPDLDAGRVAVEAILARLSATRDAWQVAADGQGFRRGDEGWVELGRRRTLTGILAALLAARPDSLDVDDLFSAGWPDQQAVPAARKNRVYVALSTLRKAGLADLVERTKEGWRLDPQATIDVV